ncbi:hypothetical protein DM01DRAFT_1340572 [Hesseltinella vesiculosa]|uniref:RNA polymerase II degradation factor 1 n=1 Tax=Hesseltinella vesiculosa TaxID=101127 RepID=A0A1X2G3P0_9FUNG|nr:hypothetical protein DM01DRAFT_1340572 [Hesseltinella vesiculosa]
MTSYATRTTDQNDLKKLKSKHANKLSTLKELFADWTDDDLLFVLEEADGVLEVAVDRISEGHANQWGEVKTKKSKKEASQKAKAAAVAAAAATSSSSTSAPSYQKSERTPAPRPSKPSRAPRPTSTANTYSKKAPAKSSSSSHPPSTSWGYSSNKISSAAESGGSWASIASTKPANEPEWSTSTDTWDNQSPSWSTSAQEQTITETTTSSALLDDGSDKPKSWASLLKASAKPEADIPIEEEPSTANDVWNAPEEPKDEWTAPVEPSTNAWGAVSLDALEPVVDEEKKASRRLKQEDPVVIPNVTDVASVDVKFGSLNLEEEPTKEETVPEPVEPVEPVEPIQETLTDTKVETNAAKEPVEQAHQTYLKQQQPPTASESTYQQTQTQMPQPPQQQQQPFGMDHLTSAYNSYQHPTGMSGFGMNPMGNAPDYGVYGADAQRAAAAAAMGYYDPSAFGNHSPAVSNASAYPSRDKFGQDGMGQGQSAPGQSQGLHGQMYPGMPYYPYYYINHYNAYQQSMYGQPMMNKSMYPNMYQQPGQPPHQPHHQQQPGQQSSSQAPSSIKPSSANTQSPYNGASANNASPYALHSQLYNQSSGYDDLQQQFGLQDYQKSPYTAGQQLHSGFLGSQSQQQPQDKNDASRSAVSQPQQPNYLSQQQFSYQQQQYPQQPYWNQ